MARLRIITDSTAHLSPKLVAQHQITVLPIEVCYGQNRFLIGPGDSSLPLFQRLLDGPTNPLQASIPPQAIREAYQRLLRETDQVLVLVSSSRLCDGHRAALAESRAFLGRCRIVVTDSMSTSWGLGLVVEAAARAAAEGKSLDETVRVVRGVLPHIYVVLFVERLDYLEHGRRIGPAQALLGTMLRIKPLLIVEDGDILPLEKVRTRTMALEKLADFVAEFASVQQVVMLRNPLRDGSDELREQLQQRLNPAKARLQFPVIEYDPVLACHIGPDALGVTVYEGF
jgi:DegV family protein with EDD domain